MREIKFRAWHKKFKDYYNVEEIYFGIKQLSLCGKRTNHDEPEIIFRAKFEDVILEQYTGLKDKNGTPIYESDILKREDGRTDSVIFEDGEYTTKNVGWTLYWLIGHRLKDLGEIIEIIGNIHEGVKSDE